MLSLIPIQIFAFIYSASLYEYLVPVKYLQNISIVLIGVILCVGSLIWTSIAQIQMGNSWRIGLDEKNKTELVNNGLFALSRNPIFLGMLITMIGFFLILPNILSFAVLVGAYLLIQIQVRLEEEFLEKKHGIKYLEFKGKVRRWI